MDSVVKLYFDTAIELRLKPEPLPEIGGFRFKVDGEYVNFRLGLVPLSDEVASSIASNKYCTNKFLTKNGFPAPKATAYDRKEYKEDPTLSELDVPFPVVCKPAVGSATGKDVYCNIPDKKHLILIMEKLFKDHKSLSIEHYEARLKSYRVLMLDYKAIAITERIPAQVIGDGKHTIAQLIEIENQKRKQLVDELPLYDFELNDESHLLLKEQKIGMLDIPYEGRKIQLRYVCNSSRGGTFIGRPVHRLHPYNHQLLSQAARLMNVRLGGFDFICEDISASLEHTRGFIIEINVGPDITIHEKVKKGTQVKVTRPILKSIIKKHKKLRISTLMLNPLVITAVSFTMIAGLLFYCLG